MSSATRRETTEASIARRYSPDGRACHVIVRNLPPHTKYGEVARRAGGVMSDNDSPPHDPSALV